MLICSILLSLIAENWSKLVILLLMGPGLFSSTRNANTVYLSCRTKQDLANNIYIYHWSEYQPACRQANVRRQRCLSVAGRVSFRPRVVYCLFSTHSGPEARNAGGMDKARQAGGRPQRLLRELGWHRGRTMSGSESYPHHKCRYVRFRAYGVCAIFKPKQKSPHPKGSRGRCGNAWKVVNPVFPPHWWAFRCKFFRHCSLKPEPEALNPIQT